MVMVIQRPGSTDNKGPSVRIHFPHGTSIQYVQFYTVLRFTSTSVDNNVEA
jgi:hypothetical protein